MSLDNNVNDKRVVVITGFSKGIGKSVAEEFAKAEYNVLINSMDEQELKIAAEEISNTVSDRNRIAFVAGDISNQHFSELLMDEALRKFGRIDVLINNGKITVEPNKINENDSNPKPKTNSKQPPYFVLEEFDLISPKIKGVYFSIKAAVTRMLYNNKNNSSIINISSCQGCMPLSAANLCTSYRSGVDPYVDSMANTETITKTIALELADKGIRVNGIIPGLVDKDMNEEVCGDTYKINQKENEIPIKRIARPQEISKVALFLASEDASYITGAMIPVDGGLILSRPNYFVEVS
jgi:NAD(P)-dependent dehydrogenase (short-subunit alcohol dehydrogenase family)